MKPAQIVEAVLFASDAPLSVADLVRADPDLDEDVVEAAIADLRAIYDEEGRAFQILEIAEGYQILTRPEFAPYLERFDSVPRPNRLSGPALEALAIIAYRQPIGRIEMEYVRGVNSAGVIRTLHERGLIDVVGRSEGIGRPLLYGTTQKFLDHFGFTSIEDLPRPEELPVVLRERIPLGIEELPPPEAPADIAPAEAPEGDRDATGSDVEDVDEGRPGAAATGEADSDAEAGAADPSETDEYDALVASEAGGNSAVDSEDR
ncbi:MAG: SMC-Scp complex subunit ScpB [Gemmatimonadota bacterium]